MEYAATVTVNPLTALRMLQDFVKLNPGALSLASSLLASSYFPPSPATPQNTHGLQSPLSGDAIVQNGATSIVGQSVIQLAKVHGIHTINIIRDR
jgi:trans-2-enoyl-CoA reductase